MLQTKAAIIKQLQKDILHLGGIKAPVHETGLQAGLDFLQPHFPQGCFPPGAVHEFLCAGQETLAPSAGFISGLISGCLPVQGVVIWIGGTAIFPPALKAFNLAPQHIIFIKPSGEKEALWIMEEALKCDSVAAVVAEMRELNFTNSRRFQLAVEQSKVTGFIINRQTGKINTNACVSRWAISSLPSLTADGLPGVGFPRWQVQLQKIRNGRPGNWVVEWAGNTFRQVLQPEAVAENQILQQKTG